MFLTTVNLAKAKSKLTGKVHLLSLPPQTPFSQFLQSFFCFTCANCRTILVQMMSAAGTGYFFNTKRNRLRDKLVLRKHDPFVNKHVLFFEKRKIRSI